MDFFPFAGFPLADGGNFDFTGSLTGSWGMWNGFHRAKIERLRYISNMEEIKMLYEGQPCRNCDTPVIQKKTKKSGRDKMYHYAWYLYCNGCKRMYHVDRARVENPRRPGILRRIEAGEKTRELARELNEGFQRQMAGS